MSRQSLLRAKFIATGKHLLFSLLLFGIALYLIKTNWYPGLLYELDGGKQGVRLMLTLFLVAGPLLTLVIINPAKSAEKTAFDLVVILVLQLATFIWGLWALNEVRPLALSYHSGVMQAVRAEDFDLQDQTPADLIEFGKSPVLVYARTPQTADERAGTAAFAVITGLTPDKLFFLFEPLAQKIDSLDFAHREEIVREYPSKREQLGKLKGRLVRYEGRYGYGVLAFNDEGSWVDSLVLETL